MDQIRPELDSVLQCLSLNGYSIFSLMDYILAPYNREDQRITPLREGIERDTTYICLLLHSHDPTGFERVLDSGRVQCTCSISRAGSHKSTRSAKLLVQSRIADMRSRSTYSRTVCFWKYLTSVYANPHGIRFNARSNGKY